MSAQDLVKPFLDPVLLLFALSLLLVLNVGKRRWLRVLFPAVFYVAAIPLPGHVMARGWSIPDSYDPARRYAAVMPLAGLLDIRRLDNPKLADGADPSLLLNDNVLRLITAIGFVREGQTETLLYGDVHVDGTSEAEIVRAFSLARGLAPDQFREIGRIARTFDEARAARRYVGAAGGGRLLLVTSALHMRRAAALFRAQGLALDTFSVQRIEAPLTAGALVPGLRGLHATHDVLYELVAYTGYLVTGRL